MSDSRSPSADPSAVPEDELRRRERQLAEAQEIAQVGSWEWDVATDALTWSEQLCRIYGLASGDEPRSYDRFLALIHPDDREIVARAVTTAFETHERFSFHHRIVRADGAVRTLHARGQATVDDDGNVAKMAGTGQDVTERLELEAQLRQAQKMVSIGRLAGGIAHDFNNMLTAIFAHAERLSAALAHEPELRRRVESIRASAERAGALTRQLLDFASQQGLELEVLSLNRVVEELLPLLHSSLPDDVDLVLDLDPRLGNIRADRSQLDQVVMNLAVNARDALPAGGRLTIATRDVEFEDERPSDFLGVGPGAYVQLSVIDDGIGIEPEILAHIFEPFYTHKEGGGTGLGLATVYGIAQQSAGGIWARSSPGAGTTIEVCFPGVDEPIARQSAGHRQPAGGQPTETLLVVEDRADVREVVTEYLLETGYRVLVAADGATAEDIAAGFDERIDLLVTDVVMPAMSGPVLTQRLAERRPGLKVLYVSGYTGGDAGYRGLIDRSAAFLRKPFTPEELAQKIRSVLEDG